jgi:hypothetical protein
MAAYFENRTNHINVQRGKNAVFKVKNGGRYTNHQDLRVNPQANSVTPF